MTDKTVFDENVWARSPATQVFAALRRDGMKANILKEVSEASGFSIADLVGPSRAQPLTLWRQIAMVRCCEVGFSLTSIGHTFNRDHTTIICAKRRIAEVLAYLQEHGSLPPYCSGKSSRKDYGLAETKAVRVMSAGTGMMQ